jgi:Fe2+ transport system protein FeoA
VTPLFWIVLATLLAVAVLAPNNGVLARWRHHRAALGREQAENALKHLFGQAAAGESASLSSLQGALRGGDRELLALTERLGREGLIRVEASPTRIVLSDGESEFKLAPMLAGNVHVAVATSTPVAPSESLVRLSDLPSGTVGEVVSLDPGCRGFIRRRLLDLGFTPGAQVRPDLTTFAGDPRAYRLRGTTIALRREQSARVLVRAVA